ncbi:ABC-three component system protein [Pelosinus sp. sgz500959]|uniref:ABC-three component system protein n=1 Tax=Pelosinus sp. sgz500959 TaxID=3242472 RepID=UPI00366F967D
MITWICQKRKKNLIIFVHGFLGDSSTWKNSYGNSFPEMLLENSKIKQNFDIAYFNYFTKLSNDVQSNLVVSLMMNIIKRRKKAKKNLDIESLGELLLSVVDYECAAYENIIIVAHSMGGLVTKSCILNSLQNHNMTRVKLFLSLAVPHQGSELTENFLAKLINNPQVYELKPVSGIIDAMNRSWIRDVKNTPKTIYFYGKYDDIVNEKSAVAIDPYNNEKIPCDDDHFTISKPERKDCHLYFVVEQAILNFLEEVSQKKKIAIQPFRDDGQFDDMNFVVKLEMANIHKFFQNEAKNSFYYAEYAIKRFKPRGSNDRKILEDLYLGIKELYGEEFGRHFRHELEAGSGLLSQVHTRINQEHEKKIKTSLTFLEEVHKKGMLHQLSNALSNEIWWNKEHNEVELNKFRTRKVSGNA